MSAYANVFFAYYSSFVCMSAYANVFFAIICECIRQINIQMSGVHCGSAVRFGRALPGYPMGARSAPQGHDQTHFFFPTCGSRKSARCRLATERSVASRHIADLRLPHAGKKIFFETTCSCPKQSDFSAAANRKMLPRKQNTTDLRLGQVEKWKKPKRDTPDCAPLVCVSAVIELLTVWRHTQTKNQNQKYPPKLLLCLCVVFYSSLPYLRTTCMRLCCNGVASCVAVHQTKNQKTSTWHDSLWIPNKQKKNLLEIQKMDLYGLPQGRP